MENIRLKTVCTFIEKDDILADIGCDHGYLGFMALDKGVHFVQFIDNKQGPLDQAIKNSANYDQNKMLFTKSSGLNNLDNNINTICICGVGGELIIEMLEDDFEKAKRLKKLILQPNRNVDNLRDYLFKNGFKILDEEVVFENKKYYEIIVCQYNKINVHFEYEDVLLGPINKVKKTDIFKKFWEEKLKEFKRIRSLKDSEDLLKKINTIENNIR